VSAELARHAIADLFTAAVATASAVILFRWRINSAWLVLGGGLASILVYGVR
jgi:chromate transporter